MKLYTEGSINEAIAEAWNTCKDNEDNETYEQVFDRIKGILHPFLEEQDEEKTFFTQSDVQRMLNGLALDRWQYNIDDETVFWETDKGDITTEQLVEDYLKDYSELYSPNENQAGDEHER